MTISRNRLRPWYIGLVIIVAAFAYTGYGMFAGGCEAPTVPKIAVLVVMPAVYLVLMFLTLVSEE